MMVCPYQIFFNLLYDYFQTGLINYICMSQFYYLGLSLFFPLFFQTVQDTLLLPGSLVQSDLDPETAHPC